MNCWMEMVGQESVEIGTVALSGKAAAQTRSCDARVIHDVERSLLDLASAMQVGPIA